MLTLILLGYIGCVYAAFKILKIKVAPVSVAVSVVTGIFVLGGITIAWKFGAPITDRMTVTRPVVPLSASQNTKEVIKKVHVQQDQPVKKGDLLYEVETAPFQYAVDRSQASLEEAKRQIQALEAGVAVAESRVAQSTAARAAAKAKVDVSRGVQKEDSGAISSLTVDIDRFSYESAGAAVEVAKASQHAAEFALASARSSLAAVEGKLATAKLELDRAYVRAPADGFIMNWQAVEGTMTTTVITSAQGTFQDTTRTRVIAVLRQNLVAKVHPGDVVEMAFASFPHRIATGKVEALLEYTGEGQLMSQGVLPVVASLGSKGFMAVRITLDDEEFARELPLGAAGTTAIYTGFARPFHAISKVVMRMKAWLYYLPA